MLVFFSRVPTGVLPYMQSIVSQSEYEVDSATYEADVAGKDAFVTQFLDFMFCKDKVKPQSRCISI